MGAKTYIVHMFEDTLHCKGAFPTRGVFTTSLGTGVNPVNAHSLTPGGASIEAKLQVHQAQL